MKNTKVGLATLIAVGWIFGANSLTAEVQCSKKAASFILVQDCNGVFLCDTSGPCYMLDAYQDIEGMFPANYYCKAATPTEGCSDQGTYDEVFEWKSTGACSSNWPTSCPCGSFGSWQEYAYHKPGTRRVDASCAGT